VASLATDLRDIDHSIGIKLRGASLVSSLVRPKDAEAKKPRPMAMGNQNPGQEDSPPEAAIWKKGRARKSLLESQSKFLVLVQGDEEN
jgi:hypothetical protein